MKVTDDQNAVIAFLGDPAAHGGHAVERIETHSAIIFLAGPFAWKLKRAVKFPFLDFSTLERRREYCLREVELNRRTASALYRAALPVTREADGSLAINGAGEPMDWLVHMNRFEQRNLFNHLTLADKLDRPLLLALADTIAAFHASAEVKRDRGGAAAMQWIVEDNIEEISGFDNVFPHAEIEQLALRTRQTLSSVSACLDQRRRDGKVRHCHGDLHLQNICLIDDRPVLFDCIEFNDDIACVDVVYDLAFLLMDLDHRGHRDHANLILNHYLARSGDYRALAVLPLYLSCRAAIRAKVTAIAAANNGLGANEAAQFLRHANEYLAVASPRLIAIGGTPGTGKSTLAQKIAPEIGSGIGAVLLRTDVLRKQMLGSDILERLPTEAYDHATTERTYDRVIEEARAALTAGTSIIADATFTSRGFRDRVEALARELDVPFSGIWLNADMALREERIANRRNDPSDATVDLIRQFRTPPKAPKNWLQLDAGQSLGQLAEQARIQLLI